MGEYYHLICVDTGEGLFVGKLFVKEEGPPRSYAFGNFSYDVKRRDDQINNDLQIKAIIHFLLRNRGRDIRLLPTTVFEKYESDFFPTTSVKSTVPTDEKGYAEIFAKPLGKPSPYEDPKFMPEKLIKRLEELQRGENIEKLPWDEPEPSKA